MTTNDTICAISTAPGLGGIAVARVSGPDAITVCSAIWQGKHLGKVNTHTAHIGKVVDTSGEHLDDAVATVFRAPKSFTGEDVVELSVHGSVYIQKELIHALCAAGARIAERGEFTRRAFSSGRFDLAQAEAVADVIASSSKAAHRLAVSQMRGDFSKALTALHDSLLELVSLLELELDFSEEDVEFASRSKIESLAQEILATVNRLAKSFRRGDAIRKGVSVAIVGETNSGKSTLLNALLHDDKAIVSDQHGTTRDVIEDTTEIGGICFRFIDTAGLRQTSDFLENEGISRAKKRMSTAMIVLWLIDGSRVEKLKSTAQDILENTSPEQSLVVVINKTDIASPQQADTIAKGIIGERLKSPVVHISAAKAHGIEELETQLIKASGVSVSSTADVVVTNARHYEALTNASASISRAIEAMHHNLPPELIAQDLRETLHHLSSITGTITTDTILQNIFSKFCIGK